MSRHARNQSNLLVSLTDSDTELLAGNKHKPIKVGLHDVKCVRLVVVAEQPAIVCTTSFEPRISVIGWSLSSRDMLFQIPINSHTPGQAMFDGLNSHTPEVSRWMYPLSLHV